MAILRRRPRVSVSVPRDIRPGQTVVVEARLDATSAVPVNWINAELECEELITFGTERSATRSIHPYLRLVALLMGTGTLPAGETVLRCKFALPPGFPPTYRGARVRCCYTLTVHVSIPWWPDRKSTFDILVGPNNDDPPGWRPDDPPAMYGTHPNGPKGNDLAIECSLDRRILEPGRDLRGMVALTNLASHRVRQLSIALLSTETIRQHGRQSEIHESAGFVLPQSVPPGTADGESLAFQMRIPDNITPSRKSGGWDLEWYLEVQAHLSLARNVKLTIPVTVVPRGAAKDKRLRAPPTVGSERVTLLWNKVAQELGWELDGDVLRGAVRDVHLAIRRDHRGADGFVLVAELTYPSLHLGLDGGAKRGFRRILGGGVSLDPAWDRRHYLAGREAAQVEAFVSAAGEALARVNLEDMDDKQAVLLFRDAGLTLGPLRGFVDRAVHVADGIAEGRGRIPAPACMGDAVEAWTVLAERLGGGLELSRMAVSGRFEGDFVEVATEWGVDPQPTGTLLRLTLGDVPRPEQQVSWEEGQFTAGGAEGLSEPCRALLNSLLHDALAFQVTDREVRLILPAPVSSTETLVEALSSLRGFALGLRKGVGPYR